MPMKKVVVLLINLAFFSNCIYSNERQKSGSEGQPLLAGSGNSASAVYWDAHSHRTISSGSDDSLVQTGQELIGAHAPLERTNDRSDEEDVGCCCLTVKIVWDILTECGVLCHESCVS